MIKLFKRLDTTYKARLFEGVVEFKSKQSKFFMQLTRFLYSPVSTFRIMHRFQVTGRHYLTDMSENAVVFITKHQTRIHDELIIGSEAYKSMKKYCKFLVTDDLYKNKTSKWLLEKLGAFSIKRPSDIKKALREARKLTKEKQQKFKEKLIAEGRRKREEAQNIILHLLLNKQPVCIFPEGKKMYQKTPEIAKRPGVISNLKLVLDVQPMLQKYLKQNITFVPVDIHFKKLFFRASHIKVKFGKPIEVENNDLYALARHTVNEIESFQSEKNYSVLDKLVPEVQA